MTTDDPDGEARGRQITCRAGRPPCFQDDSPTENPNTKGQTAQRLWPRDHLSPFPAGLRLSLGPDSSRWLGEREHRPAQAGHRIQQRPAGRLDIRCAPRVRSLGEGVAHLAYRLRRRAEGLPVGRQPGATDRKPRKRADYVASWEGGKRREAQQARAGGQAIMTGAYPADASKSPQTGISGSLCRNWRYAALLRSSGQCPFRVHQHW